jgi:hypothetical protein
VRKANKDVVQKLDNSLRQLIRVGLAALFVAYTVALFIHRELGLVDKIEQPLILATLLFIMAGLGRIEKRSARDDSPEVVVYHDRVSLYEGTRAAVEQSRHRVFVTYFRATPPAALDAAVQQHIKACRDWARNSPRHTFRRIIVNGSSPRMLSYLQEELAEMRRAQAKGRHYNVKVLNYKANDPDSLSVGLYDDDLLIISYASGTDRILGVSIRSRDVVQSFDFYYNELWSRATDIEECTPTAP